MGTTTDEKAWCKLSAQADGRVLGAKLGKKFGAVFKAVKQLTHDQLSEFQKVGTMEIEGETLSTDDIRIQRSVIADPKKYVAKVSDDNLSVILDIVEDEGLIEEWKAREIVNRVNQLRKVAGVVV